MNILAVDTCTNACGVAVIKSDGDQARAVIVSRRTHAVQLMPLIDKLLAGCDMDLKALDGFAVTRGPGSFTGLRIGISTVKGLAAALDKPLAGISSLEALAFPFACHPFLICALLGAGKGQVYSRRYRPRADGLEPVCQEEVVSPESAAGVAEPCLFVGNGAVTYRKTIMEVAGKQALFAPPTQNEIQPEAVAFLGRKRLAAGDADDTAGFAPIYIRRPDAVVNRRLSPHQA